jgi:hypothetical protein
MTRRRRTNKRLEFLSGPERVNIHVDLLTGPDFGAHDLDGPDCCEDEAIRHAELWAEWRDEYIEAEPPPEWALAVLEGDGEPPWRPDARFPPDHPIQDAYREHQNHLAAVARDAYRKETG